MERLAVGLEYVHQLECHCSSPRTEVATPGYHVGANCAVPMAAGRKEPFAGGVVFSCPESGFGGDVFDVGSMESSRLRRLPGCQG